MPATARRLGRRRGQVALELGVQRTLKVPGAIGRRIGPTIEQHHATETGQLPGGDHRIERHARHHTRAPPRRHVRAAFGRAGMLFSSGWSSAWLNRKRLNEATRDLRGIGWSSLRAQFSAAPSLEDCDEQFHDAYGRLRSAASRAAPVLVLFGDSLILLDGERRSEFAASAGCTRVIKAVAHVPVGIFATLEERAGALEEGLDPLTAQRLSQLQRAHVQAHALLECLDAASRADVEIVLEACRSFLEPILSQNRLPGGELARFASAIGPVLLRLIEHATRYELDALHAAVESALGQLTPEGRHKLEVVVAGVHQARARSLGLQYFQKRFGEAPGEERERSSATRPGCSATCSATLPRVSSPVRRCSRSRELSTRRTS
jgi:hypothetical protein